MPSGALPIGTEETTRTTILAASAVWLGVALAAFREVLEPDRTKMQSLRGKMRENRQVPAHREQIKQALRAFQTPEQQTKLDVLESMRRQGPGFDTGGLAPVGPGGQPPGWPEN